MPLFQQTLESRAGVATPVQQPVADNTRASTINFLGNLGVEAVKGYQQAKVSDATTGEVEDFLAATNARQEAPIAQAAAEQVLNTAGADSEAFTRAKADLERIATIINRGAGNTSELKMRVQARLRQYINQMPGFAPELRQTADNILGDYSGVLSSIHAEEVKPAKESLEDKVFEALLKRDDNGAIAAQYVSGNITKEETKAALLRQEANKNDFSMLERLQKEQNINTDLLAREPRFDNGLEAIRLSTSGSITRIIDNSAIPKDQKETMITNEVAKALTQVAPYRNGEVGRSKVAALEKALNDVAIDAKDVVSGKRTKEYLANSIAITESKATEGLYAMEERLPQYKAFISALGPAAQSLNINTALIPEYMKLWNRLTTNKNPFLEDTVGTKDKKGFYDMIAGAVKQNIDSKDTQGAIEWMTTLADDISKGKGVKEEDYNGLVATLADEKIGKEIYSKATPNQQATMLQPVESYMGDLIGASIKAFNPATMTLVNSDDGRLLVRAKPDASFWDKRSVENMNVKLMGRMNNSIRALSHIQKGSDNYKAASDQVYKYITDNAKSVAPKTKPGLFDNLSDIHAGGL